MTNSKNKYAGTDFKELLKDQLKNKSFQKKYELARKKIALDTMIRRIMKQKKLSIRNLAKEMGTSLSQVQRLIENKNVSLDSLCRFATATGKRLEILFR